MGWLFLIIVGGFEITGVTGMQMVTLKGLILLFISFIFSFTFLSFAMQTISLGISYAVWAGVGTVGSTLVGMMYYGESKDKLRMFFIALVVVAVAGLRLSS